MSVDETAYIFKSENNKCDVKSLNVPSEYVEYCYQCSNEENLKATISTSFNYPDFSPAKNALKDLSAEEQKAAGKNLVRLHFFSSFKCDLSNLKEARSKDIQQFLNSRLNSKRPNSDNFSPIEKVGKNFYVSRNYGEFSASEEIFFYKTDELYEFVSVCHSYGCTNAQNVITGIPYTYMYEFQKPENESDMVKIHQDIENFVQKIYYQKQN